MNEDHWATVIPVPGLQGTGSMKEKRWPRRQMIVATIQYPDLGVYEKRISLYPTKNPDHWYPGSHSKERRPQKLRVPQLLIKEFEIKGALRTQ